jgi:hypothetical protein
MERKKKEKQMKTKTKKKKEDLDQGHIQLLVLLHDFTNALRRMEKKNLLTHFTKMTSNDSNTF